MNHLNTRCSFCGDEAQFDDLGFWLCAACRAKMQKCKCHQCGSHWVQRGEVEPQVLCSACSMRNFLAQADPQKLNAVREQLHLHNLIRAVKEAREQFNISISQSMDVVAFLQNEPENQDNNACT